MSHPVIQFSILRLVIWILSIILVFPVCSLAGITFEKAYGGLSNDIAYSVEQTHDGGYIITGGTASFGAGDWDVYLVKTDSSGDTVWTRAYGGVGIDGGRSVRQTQDKGYILVGQTESFGAGKADVYFIKTDSSGDTIWTRTYGGSGIDRGSCVELNPDGGYIIAGHTESFGAGEFDAYVIRTDSFGEVLWTKTYGDFNRDSGQFIRQTSDGGYIIGGTTHSFGSGGADVYLIKTDSSGDTVWTRAYGGHTHDIGYSVQQTSDGGYIVAGWTYSFDQGMGDVYLIKTDSSGDTVWTRTFGGAWRELGYSAQETLDGGYIVAAFTESFAVGSPDAYLIKTDSSGDSVWTRTYGGARWDEAFSVQQTSDGGYILAGWTFSLGAGWGDVYLVKTDGRGFVGVCDPICLKENVLAELDTLKPQSKSLAKKIRKAKKHIEKSLEPKRWLDETHLHHKHGKKVFYEEKKAVKEIKKLCKKGEFPSGLCERLIGMLVEADSILARVAIDDAIAANGKEKEIEKAEKEMAKAEEDKEKEKYDKAVDHYKHAWQHAQKAVKKHKESNQMAWETKVDGRSVLLQNRPNPVISSTRFEFVLEHAAEARLTVHDVAGRKVWEFAPSPLPAGQHTLEWDCLDTNGTRLPSGVYIYKLETGSFSQTRKMVIVR